jgi:hypothetical protein
MLKVLLFKNVIILRGGLSFEESIALNPPLQGLSLLLAGFDPPGDYFSHQFGIASPVLVDNNSFNHWHPPFSF